MRHSFKMLVVLSSFILLCAHHSYSQDSIKSTNALLKSQDSFWKRVSVGGNLGFQVGNVTGITVAPEVRIRAIDQLHFGFRFLYQYFSYKDYFYDYSAQYYISFHSNVFGAGIYARYYLSGIFDGFLGNLFAHVEYEYMSYTWPFTQSSSPTANIQDPYGMNYVSGDQLMKFNSVFVGGGYRQMISNKVSMDLLILFNINESINSPYTNPVFRFGVGVGL